MFVPLATNTLHGTPSIRPFDKDVLSAYYMGEGIAQTGVLAV